MARKRTYKILLSDEDKKVLHATIHNKKTCKMTIRRCQILLDLDEDAPQHLNARRKMDRRMEAELLHICLWAHT